MQCLDELKSFQKLLETGDYSGASALAPSLLSDASNPDSDTFPIRSAIIKGYTRCLLELEDFEKLKQVLEQEKESSQLPSELSSVYRYTLYRLRSYSTLEAPVVDPSPAAAESTHNNLFDRHLQAQVLYNLSKTEDALKIYEELLSECHDDAEEREQLLVNLTASQLAQAVPFVRTLRSHEKLVKEVMDASDVVEVSSTSSSSPSAYPLDLVYNYATLLSLEGDASAVRRLQTALAHANNDLDCETIKYNIDWSIQFHAGPSKLPASSKPLSANPHIQSVQLCSSGDIPGVSKHKFTALQSRMALYNTAVSHLRENKLAECQKVCKDILLQAGRADVWWMSRVTVLQAYCDKSKASELLQTKLDQVQKLDESLLRDAAWLYLEVHRAQLMGEKTLDASKLPPSLRSSNGVLAMKVRQHHRQRDDDTIQLSLAQKADSAMSTKDYPQAVQLYQELYEQSRDPLAKARLVMALSHVDPQKAIDMWTVDQKQSDQSVLSTPPLMEEANGAELEQQVLPLLKTNRPTSILETNKPKKSRESVMRRRAKKREEYLAKLEEKGLYRKDRPTKPDPERWLPKMERSHGRKKKGKTHKGAQGGVSEKEASKLDVVARQNAIASDLKSSTPSTAHIAASSESAVGGRKSGRRR